MRIEVVNRQTGELHSFPLKNFVFKGFNQRVLLSKNHAVGIIAENSDEIDFVAKHFTVPLPSAHKKAAIWTGDFAAFIIMNFPTAEELKDDDL